MADPVVVKEGYEQIPASDLKGLKDASEGLKNLRSLFPEEYRGKEGDFFKSMNDVLKEHKELKDKGKTDLEKLTGDLDAIKKENASLKGQTTKETNELKTQLDTISKENHNLKMWGHISRQMQLRNTGHIEDVFFDDSVISSFDLKKYDLSSQDGLKVFGDDFYKTILEPATKKQEAAFARYTQASGGSGVQPALEKPGQPSTQNNVPQFTRMGQRA